MIRLTYSAMKTRKCPGCGLRGQLRELIYGMRFEPIDESRYKSAGCAIIGIPADIICLECGWEGFKNYFPRANETFPSANSLRSHLNEPGHHTEFARTGKGETTKFFLKCQCGKRLEIKNFGQPWSFLEEHVLYRDHLNAVSPGIGDRYFTRL
ncbi:MAG: hypothetical protein WCH42_07260 [Actinomycetes bacterium]